MSSPGRSRWSAFISGAIDRLVSVYPWSRNTAGPSLGPTSRYRIVIPVESRIVHFGPSGSLHPRVEADADGGGSAPRSAIARTAKAAVRPFTVCSFRRGRSSVGGDASYA
jgi:hypothetical protein